MRYSKAPSTNTSQRENMTIPDANTKVNYLNCPIVSTTSRESQDSVWGFSVLVRTTTRHKTTGAISAEDMELGKLFRVW